MKSNQKSTFWRWLGAAIAAAVIIGCGGGGSVTGGGTTGGGIHPSTATKPTGQYLEFWRGSTLVDPLNLSAGDVVQVQFVNYDAVGNRTALNVTNFQLTGSGAGSAVTISSSGILTVHSSLAAKVTVSATARVSSNDITLTQDVYTPNRNNVRIAGTIRAQNSGVPVTGVQVEFVDSLGNFKGGAVVDAVGNFNGVAEAGAAFLRVKPASVPVAYFAAIRYQNVNYAVTGTACLLPLPGTSSGTNTYPSLITMPRQVDGPPPPPSGC